MAVRFDAILGKLLTKYVKTTGDTMTGALGIGATTPRTTNLFDVLSTGTGTIGNASGGSIVFNYSGGGYYNEGLGYQFDVYAYRTFGATKVYSSTAHSITGTDNNNSDSNYNLTVSWTAVNGAEGYRVVVVGDSYYGASGNHYFDISGNQATIGLVDTGYVSEISDYYTPSTPPTVTPTSTTAGADFYLDEMGDLHSTGNFYFNNYPSLVLGSNNGLTLTGISAKVLTLPTTANVNLNGISLKSGRIPTGNHIVFPQGSSGATSPGIRFEGGQTDGGLAMNDGILEFWNNWRAYCTNVPGRLQGIFRYDTRSGYEVEGFTIGGTTPGGTDFMAIGINFNNADINMAYYGYGAIALGWDTSNLGIYGKNGWVGMRYTAKIGGGIIIGYVAKTANYTITETDYTINCTANSFTVTLPSAATWTGQIYNIKNSGTGVITIATTSSQTIDGNASGVLTLVQYDNLTVQSNGANWIIL